MACQGYRVCVFPINFCRPEGLSKLFLRVADSGLFEIRESFSKATLIVGPEANDALSLNGVKQIEAPSGPDKLLFRQVFDLNAAPWVITEADIGQIFQFHCLFEFDRQSLAFWYFNVGPSHDVKSWMIGLHVQIHQGLVTFLKML